MNSNRRASFRVSVQLLALGVLLVGSVAVYADDQPEAPPPPGTEQPQPAEPAKTPEEPAKPAVPEGFTATETGLMYKVLAEGAGPTPNEADLVYVKYQATLEDGTEFDHTDKHPAPVKYRMHMPPRFMPSGVIEAVAAMKAGEKRLLIVPPALGFGLRGMPPRVPGNSTLRYEIELVEVTPPPQMTPTKPEDETKTESGVRYVDLVAGTGAVPSASATIKIRAATWQVDGTLLNTTTDRADPLVIPVARVPEAVKDCLIDMKVGGKRKIFIPDPAQAPTTQPTAEPVPIKFVVELELVDVVEPPTIPVTPEDGYTTTPTGLKYYDLKVGEGASPSPEANVTVHYTGWLEDGSVFDSSVVRDSPATFPLQGVIAGWTEGLGTMKVGGKRKLVIPADLAYGDQARPGIPANSILIFEVELLEIAEPVSPQVEATPQPEKTDPVKEAEKPETPDKP